MTVRDVCDVAHVLLIERVERQALADRQIAALEAVMGGKGGDLPTVGDAVAAFDAALLAEPAVRVQVSDDQAALRRALGVG